MRVVLLCCLVFSFFTHGQNRLNTKPASGSRGCPGTKLEPESCREIIPVNLNEVNFDFTMSTLENRCDGSLDFISVELAGIAAKGERYDLIRFFCGGFFNEGRIIFVKGATCYRAQNFPCFHDGPNPGTPPTASNEAPLRFQWLSDGDGTSALHLQH